MVNYHLSKMRKYHEKNMCRSNWALRHTEKLTERKSKSKSCYYDIPYNRMGQNNAI